MAAVDINPAGDPFASMNKWVYRFSLATLVLLLIVNFGGAWFIVLVYHGLGFYSGEIIPTAATLWDNVWRIAVSVGILVAVQVFWYQVVRRLGEF